MGLGVVAVRDFDQRGRAQHVFLVVEHVWLPLHAFGPGRYAAKQLLHGHRLVVPGLPLLLQVVLQLLLLLVAEFQFKVLIDDLELLRTEPAGVLELQVAGGAGTA